MVCTVEGRAQERTSRPGGGPPQEKRADGAAGAAWCRPGRAVPAGRALGGAGRRLRAGGGVAGRVPGGCRGGGGEPVGAGLVGDHLRGAEADQLVEGIRDRAGRAGEHLADRCGVNAVLGNLRRCSSTRSRSAPGRVAGARRPLAAALTARRPWAARSRAVSKAARAPSKFPAARALAASSAACAMASTFPAASVVTAGSGPGSVPASAF